jgi:hypothetical protein
MPKGSLSYEQNHKPLSEGDSGDRLIDRSAGGPITAEFIIKGKDGKPDKQKLSLPRTHKLMLMHSKIYMNKLLVEIMD